MFLLCGLRSALVSRLHIVQYVDTPVAEYAASSSTDNFKATDNFTASWSIRLGLPANDAYIGGNNGIMLCLTDKL